MSAVRDNWRIALLAVAVLGSLFLLFGPIPGENAANPNATAANASGGGLTNLEYGLELSGGTRVQAPLIGVTAENVSFDGTNRTAVETAVADQLEGVPPRDVQILTQSTQTGRRYALEVRANVSQSAVRSALSAVGLTADTVRQGVTAQTRNEVTTVLQNKIDETGIQGGSVRTIRSVSEGQYFVVVDVPNANRSEVRSLLEGRGSVRILAYHQAENGTYVNRTVATNDDFDFVSPPRQDSQGTYVAVTVRQSGGTAREFQEDMVETGIASRGGTDCGWPANGTDGATCILITRGTGNDTRVVGAFGMQRRLAGSMLDGDWAESPTFQLPTGNNFSEAHELSVNLRAGELPTGLALERGTINEVSASFAADARLNAVLAALAAVLAVTGVVVARYGDVRVAIPMVLTALSEVILLLGFAAGVGLALDLSHIAGFIAVIGTGVDDLVIIADDILQQGEVRTDRVFRSRFRKALWVIGAAAATTIIAMTPLAVLSLQSLRGFAIVTIVGVLLGVLVTRPAYGDILRSLVMGQDDGD